MAFLAVCPACDRSQVCVLDNRVRSRVVCLNCRTVFETGAAAPAPASQAAPPPLETPRPAVKPKLPPPPVVAPAPTSAPVAAPVAAPVVVYSKASAPADESDDDDDESTPRLLKLLRKWMNPLGAIGLGICALALLIAAIGRLSIVVPFLAAAAAIVGLIATRRAHKERRPLVMPVTAASLGTLLFLFAVAIPAALGPSYEAARDSAPSEPQLQVLPHPRFTHDPEVVQDGWVDASKAGMQQARVRVEVTDVWIETPTAKKGKVAPAPTDLCVRVRLQRSKTGKEIVAGSFAAPLLWDEKVQATLFDLSGTGYAQKPLPPGRARAVGPSSHGATALDVTTELLLFDIPATATQGLRLELPASAWGGTGTLKFLIPGSMVRVGSMPGRLK